MRDRRVAGSHVYVSAEAFCARFHKPFPRKCAHDRGDSMGRPAMRWVRGLPVIATAVPALGLGRRGRDNAGCGRRRRAAVRACPVQGPRGRAAPCAPRGWAGTARSGAARTGTTWVVLCHAAIPAGQDMTQVVIARLSQTGIPDLLPAPSPVTGNRHPPSEAGRQVAWSGAAAPFSPGVRSAGQLLLNG
jgi:hypothetical protein